MNVFIVYIVIESKVMKNFVPSKYKLSCFQEWAKSQGEGKTKLAFMGNINIWCRIYSSKVSGNFNTQLQNKTTLPQI